MPRSFYFQLAPEGLGTSEVECLGSYLRRLAAHHGATLFQLLSHLDAWSRHENRGWQRNMPLSKRCQDGQYGGYSTDVERIVQIAEAATGLDTLRATTLLAMRRVCSRNGIDALKRIRAWCPACYAESYSTGQPVYDRLLWQIQGIHRCPNHNVRLVQRCWNCGCVQKSNCSTTTFDRCELCEAPLAGQAIERCTPRDDIYDLEHVESLIEFTSSDPGLEFEYRQLATFCGLMIKRYTRSALQNHLGNVFHASWRQVRPTLATLLAISAYFDIPVHWILTGPIDAAAQMDLGFDPIVRQRTARRYGDPVRSARGWTALNDAINGKPPYPSIPVVASLAGTSTGYLRAKYGKEVDKLVELRRMDDSVTKLAKTRAARRMLKDTKDSGRFTTERERIRWVAQRVPTSIHHVRQIHEAMLMSPTHRQP